MLVLRSAVISFHMVAHFVGPNVGFAYGIGTDGWRFSFGRAQDFTLN